MIAWGSPERLDMRGWAAACFASQENRPKWTATCAGCGAIVQGVALGVTVVSSCVLCAGATGKGNDGQQTEAQAQADGQP